MVEVDHCTGPVSLLYRGDSGVAMHSALLFFSVKLSMLFITSVLPRLGRPEATWAGRWAPDGGIAEGNSKLVDEMLVVGFVDVNQHEPARREDDLTLSHPASCLDSDSVEDGRPISIRFQSHHPLPFACPSSLLRPLSLLRSFPLTLSPSSQLLLSTHLSLSSISLSAPFSSHPHLSSLTLTTHVRNERDLVRARPLDTVILASPIGVELALQLARPLGLRLAMVCGTHGRCGQPGRVASPVETRVFSFTTGVFPPSRSQR